LRTKTSKAGHGHVTRDEEGFAMTIGTLLGIAVAAGHLAHTAAQRRSRNAALWAVIGFLFPVSLLVIWSLGSRTSHPAQA
jgi:uncharacterized membrane protein